MSEAVYDVDPQLRAEFIDESMDGLTVVSALFLELENDAENSEHIESIFRVVHTIKGTASYFKFMDLKDLAHELENLMDSVRKGFVFPNGDVIDCLLSGTDELMGILEISRSGESKAQDRGEFDQLIARIASVSKPQGADDGALWDKLLSTLAELNTQDLVDSGKNSSLSGECLDIAQTLAKHLGMGGEDDANDPPSTEDLPPVIIELIELLSDEDEDMLSEENTAQLITILTQLQKDSPSEEFQGAFENALDDINMFKDSIGIDTLARSHLLQQLDTVLHSALWTIEEEPESTVSSSPVEELENEKDSEVPQEAKKVDKKSSESAEGERTMRVTESTIDAFLSYVGELVVVGEMYQHFHMRLASSNERSKDAIELKRINEGFDELSRQLQTSIMSIRMVPIAGVLKRMPRIIRDIAGAQKKDIQTIVEGTEIQIDKSLVDAIEGPMVHMVRNAADHGIESPEKRKEKGKEEQGTISITAIETADNIEITIQDDGNGLNLDALRKKAIAMNMSVGSEGLSDADLTNLVFAPGLSTAKEVTDVSGRGVGMDVVRRTIEERGGSILVNTEPGAGSVFKITLPKVVTTQILAGFVVGLSEQQYVLPLESVLHCFRPDGNSVTKVINKFKCVQVGECFIPVHELNSLLLGMDSDAMDSHEGTFIVVESNSESIALHVDEVIGIKRVVLKNIDGLDIAADLFMGGAVMGDGTVAMVLDVDQIGASELLEAG